MKVIPVCVKPLVFAGQVDIQYLKGPRIISVDASGLETAQLGLEFRAWSKHFRHGDMKLKCLATISSVYRRSNERRIAGDEGFLKQPMESRETRAQSHTRTESASGKTQKCLNYSPWSNSLPCPSNTPTIPRHFSFPRPFASTFRLDLSTRPFDSSDRQHRAEGNLSRSLASPL
jgi:hypothetical protein